MTFLDSRWTQPWRTPFAVPFDVADGLPVWFTDIPESESWALQDFYYATDGPNWTNNTGWVPRTFGYTGLAADAVGVTVVGGRVTQLNKSANAGLAGDGLGSLATLTALTSLNLHSTSVSGDVSGLAPLTALTYLNLYNTSISGDVSGLAPLTALTVLYLYNTSISGAIAGLAPLTVLRDLRLFSTSVSGDVGGLAPLTALAYLYLNGTSITASSTSDISSVPLTVVFSAFNAKMTTEGMEAVITSLYADRATRAPINVNISGQTHPDTGAAQPVNAATEAMCVDLVANHDWIITRTAA